MAKNTNTQTQDDNFDFGFDFGGLSNDRQMRIQMYRMAKRNPYSGNAKPILTGGYIIPFKQNGDDVDPARLAPIGPKGKMRPLNGNEYEGFVAQSVEICILGATKPANYVDESAILDKDQNPRRVCIGKNWIREVGTNEKSVTYSSITIYFVIRNDPNHQLYSISFDKGDTKPAIAMLDELTKVTHNYAKLAAKALGRAVPPPPFHAFWVRLGVTEEARPFSNQAGQSGYITPPVLIWENGKLPSTIEAFKAIRVTNDEFNEVTETWYRPLKEYLDSPYAPDVPRELSPAFLEKVGYVALPSGEYAKQGALPASKPLALSDGNKANKNKTAAQLMAAGATEAEVSLMFVDAGFTAQDALDYYEVDALSKIPVSVADAIKELVDLKNS